MRWANVLNFLNPAAPKGRIPCARRWVDEQRQVAPQMRSPQPAAWAKEVFPAEDNMHLLETGDALPADEEFGSVRWASTPAATLFYLRGCRLLGHEGAVISPDNRVFTDFTLPPGAQWPDHSCFTRRRIPPVRKLKGWYATLAWPEAQFFFHWMVESLPRMAVLGDRVRALDGVFLPGPIQRFQVAALEALGVPESKIIPLDAQSHYGPEHLFVPHAYAMYNPPRWMHRWYKASFLGNAAPPGDGRLLYISRADAPARRVANESEVEALLRPLGFESLTLGGRDFAEQAQLFHAARVIVAPHGAGLANLVFCRPGTVVIEALPPGWMAPCFMTLALSAECRYRYLVAQRAPSAAPPKPQRDDVLVPVDRLAALVRAEMDRA